MGRSVREDAQTAEPVRAAPTATIQAKPAERPVVPVSMAGNAAVRRLVAGGGGVRSASGAGFAGGGVGALSGAGMGALSGGGCGALSRFGGGLVQAKLSVSQPTDPLEREADAVAGRVVAGAGGAVAVGTVSGARPVLPASGGTGSDGADKGAAGSMSVVSPVVEALIRDPGAGEPLPDGVRERIESHLGVGLGGVRVHSGSAAQDAAGLLNARAFTFGNHIFLGPGESPGDVGLMAHEATHVVQQQTVNVYRDMVHRSSDSVLPDFIVNAARSYAHGLPGYDMLTVVAGYDPIDDRSVDRSPQNLVRGVIGLVPFGNQIADRLLGMELLQDVFTMVDQGLTANNLTLARIQGDMDRAWAELSLANGLSGNAEIISRYVDALYRDALGFARSLVDAVLQMIRDAAVGLAEGFLADSPLWELVKKVLRHDPLRGVSVDATPVEILTDFLNLIGESDTVAQMQERGTLQQTADWLAAQVGRFLSLIGELGALFTAGWNAIRPENIANLPDNLRALAHTAVDLIGRVAAFGAELMVAVLRLVKDALLGWLSSHAHELPGFRLLTVIIGTNPFTGQSVPRTAEGLIGGFIALLPGGEATYAKLAESGVIADAAAQITGAMARLNISLDLITGTFLGVWNSLGLADLLNPVAAFGRVLDRFGEPLARIVAFVAEVIKVVITLILKLMNFPSDLLGSIINNAMQAIEDIKRDPVAFLVNMLAALKAGLSAFFDHVMGYLLDGLAAWLFRGLGQLGISKPKDYSLESILDLALQVLGITAEKLWKKLGDQIGHDKVEKIRGAIDTLTGVWTFIRDVQEGGVAAIWKHVEAQLGNLWDTLLDMAKDFIVTRIIEKVTTKLLSMLDPTGIMAVVNSMIAFYNAIQSAIEYLRDILEIINDYVTTFAAVAAGNIGPGAVKVERGLANSIPVAIGFLANQASLGNIPEVVVEIIQSLRKLVEDAIEWLFAQAIRLGTAALNAIIGGGAGAEGEPPGAGAEDPNGVKAAAGRDLAAATRTPIASRDALQAVLDQIMNQHRAQGLKSLEVREGGGSGRYTVFAVASPEDPIGEIVDRPNAPYDPTVAIELALDALSGQTHAFVEYGEAGGVPELDVHYQNDPGGLHAEARFISDLPRQLARYPAGVKVPIRLKINRLPCETCATALDGTAGSTYPNRITLQVSSTSIYGGRRIVSWMIEGGRVEFRMDPYVRAKRDTILRLMSRPNVAVDVWDIWGLISAEAYQDARLVGLDPDLVARNLEASRQLEGYLTQVIASVGPSFAGTKSK